MYMLGVLLVASYVCSASALSKCPCSKEMYRPVCGSDDRTYANKCMLHCAYRQFNSSLKIKSVGKCIMGLAEKQMNSCDCFKNFKSEPVCGSDGSTYGNPCLLGCTANKKPGLKMLHEGRC